MSSRIVVFGAGGRAGRRAVAEAVARRHLVTAVVRDTGKHRGLAGEGVSVVAGDVTRADSVAEVAAGHDAAINAAGRLDMPSAEFYSSAAHALLDGLARAGVGRLVLVGIGSTLETAPGVAVHDAPGFPGEARAFSLGHTAELDVLCAAETDIDWLVIAPPPVMLDDEAPRTGRYRTGDNRVLPAVDGATSFSYADLAVALIDEIESPKHHRSLTAVAA
ncbi:NAD(P)H-binding protein [Streptomyces sp. NBC_00053]|uniref:NAD(P)-dependent oxidoreductase n=1 Tax=unclassified Streptomyces TaxID=2593676 RepID=UPI00225BC41D|nr:MULTISPECIES: NAD(P)H-binding protein [unclassified Streptomyces]MCX4396542.1 NAD(P)H-binding protein [Streptomyces sp. NBC_01767]MCX5500581.1 NAD(P)H-binding protein [Streptomyces sp. NBC_00052]MCX5550884.1 NAD(P)H-binding protein [Streptomyces sp. NBC_00051]WSP48993.1 NAD(P)H-binding protein [Streptomyces sp. NBC_01243]